MRVEELARCWLDLSCAPVHLISLEANVICVSFFSNILSVIANSVVDKYTIVPFID